MNNIADDLHDAYEDGYQNGKKDVLSIIEEIKAEIKQIRTDYCGGYIELYKQEVLKIIDRVVKEHIV